MSGRHRGAQNGRDLAFAGTELPTPRRVSVTTRRGRVRCHVYAPRSSASGAYVHLHGGAFVMRYPQMDDWWCRYVAATADVRVVNVDFRTGPYVAYPVAQEQCHDVAAAIAAEAPVTIGGFSSGGGLAASVCLQARDLGSFTPRLQVLGVPALDLASDLPTGAGMISLSGSGIASGSGARLSVARRTASFSIARRGSASAISCWRIMATRSRSASVATPGIGRALPAERVAHAAMVASGVNSSAARRRFHPLRRPPFR